MPLYLTRFSYTPATWAKLMQNPEDRRHGADNWRAAYRLRNCFKNPSIDASPSCEMPCPMPCMTWP